MKFVDLAALPGVSTGLVVGEYSIDWPEELEVLGPVRS